MKAKRLIPTLSLILLAAMLLPLLAGCAEAPEADLEEKMEEHQTQEQYKSKVDRLDAGDLTSSQVSDVVSGSRDFAVDLYHQLRGSDGNLFYSPYSISAALAMTFAGAEGNTRQQMAEVMGFDPEGLNLHQGFNNLDQHLMGLGDLDMPEDRGAPFQLRIANALWGEQEYMFQKEFLDLLAAHYGAGMNLMDFINQPDASRQEINNWVSDQTEEKIQNLIPEDGVTTDTRLVLSNAIYFKAAWMEQFEVSDTKPGVFYTLDGAEVEVDMMGNDQSDPYYYYAGEGFQALSIPYIGNQSSLLILVPDKGEFAAVEERFSSGLLEEIISGLEVKDVVLNLPKFGIESSFSLAEALIAMGMTDAFSDQADFSGMTGNRDLFLSAVFHKAFLNVNEEGTEAAAATAVIAALASMPTDTIKLVVDRPFMFLIRDMETGAVLFMGRLVSP